MLDAEIKPAPGEENVYRARDPQGRALRWATMRATVVDGEPVDDGDEGTPARKFHGEAIVFNSPTWIGSKRWGYREIIAPEAVTETLKNADIRFLINHDPSQLLARNTSGTLRLNATATALEVEADLPDVSYAEDLAVLLDRDDINQMSFAFTPTEWETREDADGTETITITALDLFDVSVVTFPAYEDTSAGMRSLAFDVLCRSAGLDADAERKLMRDLTGAPLTNGDAAATRAAELVEKITSPDGEVPSGNPAGASGSASRDGGTPDGEAEEHPNPGDRLRELAADEWARAIEKDTE